MPNIKPVVILPYDKEINFGGALSPVAENAPVSEIQDIVPANPPAPVQRKPRSRYGRLTTILKIFKKLDQIKSFNDEFKISREDGSFVENSDIAKLLNVTQTHVRNNKGMTELIRHLHLAKIDPELIVNETIKAQLLQKMGIRDETPPPNSPLNPVISPDHASVSDVNEVPVEAIPKRPNTLSLKRQIDISPISDKKFKYDIPDMKRQIREESPTDLRSPSPPHKKSKIDKNETALADIDDRLKDIKEGNKWEIPF